ncbi:hypothetical protein [Helicobacter sp. 23-1045]
MTFFLDGCFATLANSANCHDFASQMQGLQASLAMTARHARFHASHKIFARFAESRPNLTPKYRRISLIPK